MQLSQSWIEGTAAQLVRDDRSPAVERCNATDVATRVRHQLVELALDGTVPYMEALETAKRRVAKQLRGGTTAGD